MWQFQIIIQLKKILPGSQSRERSRDKKENYINKKLINFVKKNKTEARKPYILFWKDKFLEGENVISFSIQGIIEFRLKTEQP